MKAASNIPLDLPAPPKAAGNYEPCVVAGNLLFISGQFPFQNGTLAYTGAVGSDLTEEQGCAAARIAALNVLTQIQQVPGGLGRLKRLIRLEGHVACGGEFRAAPKILDVASEVFISALGERGRHARTAFCTAMLPLNATIELVVIAELKRERAYRAATTGGA